MEGQGGRGEAGRLFIIHEQGLLTQKSTRRITAVVGACGAVVTSVGVWGPFWGRV